MCLSFDTAPFYFQTRKEEIKSSYTFFIGLKMKDKMRKILQLDV